MVTDFCPPRLSLYFLFVRSSVFKASDCVYYSDRGDKWDSIYGVIAPPFPDEPIISYTLVSGFSFPVAFFHGFRNYITTQPLDLRNAR